MKKNTPGPSWLLAACLLLAASRLVWLDDAPFVYDEPVFFQTAFTANARGQLPGASPLMSTRGLTFGPLNIWIDQAFLYFTRDIRTILRIRTLLVALVLVGAMLWCVRLFPTLVPEVVLLPLLSPYFWHHGRDLWDNTLLIPLSAVAFAAYLSFCKEPRRWKLFLVGFCLTLELLLHLMALPLVAAVALHFIWRHRAYLRRHYLSIAGFGLVYLATGSPYLRHLVALVGRPGGVSAGRVNDARHLLSAFGLSWYGAQIFSFLGYGPDLPWWWSRSGFSAPFSIGAVLGLGFTAVAYPLSWYGLYLAVKRVTAEWRLRSPSLIFDGAAVATLCFGLNVAMFCWGGVDFHPHYFHGVWVATFFFIWLAVSASAARWMRRGWGVYATCLALGVGLHAWVAHRDAGFLKGRKYTSIGNLLAVAEEVNRYPEGTKFRLARPEALVSVASIDVLRELTGGAPKAGTSEIAKPEILKPEILKIDFVHPEDPRDARLRVVGRSSGE